MGVTSISWTDRSVNPIRAKLGEAICPDWRAKAFAPSRLPNLARAFRSDSETMDEIGEDFDVSYRTAVSERDALLVQIATFKSLVLKTRDELAANADVWQAQQDALTAVLTEARRVLREVRELFPDTGTPDPDHSVALYYGQVQQALAAVLAQEEPS